MSTPSRIRVFRLAAIALFLMASILFAGVCLVALTRMDVSAASPTPSFAGADFVPFYVGARLAAAGHPELAYDLEATHSLEKRVTQNEDFCLLPIVYPPFYLLMLMPLASFDYLTAYHIWVALTLALLIAAAWRLAPHWHTLLLTPIFPAVAFCAAAGQNGNLSAAIIGTGLVLLPRRPIAAGIVFGLMAYKPQLALALPFCLLGGRHYRALFAMAVSALATVGIVLLAFGSDTLVAFLPSLGAQSHRFFDGMYYIGWSRMPTVLVAMLEMTGSKPLAWTAQLLASSATAAALVWVWGHSTDLRWRSLALVASIPLLTPYFIDYDLPLLLIPVLLLSNGLRADGWRWNIAGLMAVIWLAYPFLFVFRLAPAIYGRVQPGALVWLILLACALRATHARSSLMPQTAGAAGSNCQPAIRS